MLCLNIVSNILLVSMVIYCCLILSVSQSSSVIAAFLNWSRITCKPSTICAWWRWKGASSPSPRSASQGPRPWPHMSTTYKGISPSCERDGLLPLPLPLIKPLRTRRPLPQRPLKCERDGTTSLNNLPTHMKPTTHSPS